MSGVTTVKTALFNETYHAAYEYVSDFTAFTLLGALRAGGISLNEPVRESGLHALIACEEQNRPLLNWAIHFLEQQEFVRRTTGPEGAAVLELTPKGRDWTNRGNPFPAVHVAPSLKLIEYAGTFWLESVRGEIEPRHRLFNREGIALWEVYFHNAHDLYAVHNQWAAEELADLLPAEPCTILELGTGFGSATRALLTEIRLRSKSVEEYTVSDVSRLLTTKAGRMLEGELPPHKLRQVTLDINEVKSGGETYDFIYAVNVMHCAEDLALSLDALRRLLKPGGTIVLSECVREHYRSRLHQEFIFSLLPDFKPVGGADGDVSCFGFLRPEDWRDVMQAAGYRDICVKVNEGPVRGAIITGSRED
ncbi:bifunctional 2-polyprenyl-6-hydroxyphenol methylase/3-demethylubiquinol 3-O-methyltransferase UbiG [Paenibacillus sp. UNC499MF]|uniref:class I SAM-dependent methyltransferase n=1 Tax=Paenibacillus sp. UNC499MF TaxID=1502751 RepID=UPI00089FCF5D|nr:class I SAM-dependent methyltransferase [Paenibacillus sp. UNC499MF]SEF87096.1 Methyltransferase domain-containing protein [Paenibacillus sp. UNC499MF]